MEIKEKQTRANCPEMPQNQKGSDSSLSDPSDMSNALELPFEKIVEITESKIQAKLASVSLFNAYCMWNQAKNLEGQSQTSGDVSRMNKYLEYIQKDLREVFSESARAEQEAARQMAIHANGSNLLLAVRMRANGLISFESDMNINEALSILEHVSITSQPKIIAAAIEGVHEACNAAERYRMERKHHMEIEILLAQEAAAVRAAVLDREREERKEIVVKPPRPPPPPGPPPLPTSTVKPDSILDKSKSEPTPQTSPRSSSPVTTNSANSSISTESSNSVSKNLDSRTSSRPSRGRNSNKSQIVKPDPSETSSPKTAVVDTSNRWSNSKSAKIEPKPSNSARQPAAAPLAKQTKGKTEEFPELSRTQVAPPVKIEPTKPVVRTSNASQQSQKHQTSNSAKSAPNAKTSAPLPKQQQQQQQLSATTGRNPIPSLVDKAVIEKEERDRLSNEKVYSALPTAAAVPKISKNAKKKLAKKNLLLLPTIPEQEDTECDESTILMSSRDDGNSPYFPPVNEFYENKEEKSIAGRSPAIPGVDDHERSLYSKLMAGSVLGEHTTPTQVHAIRTTTTRITSSGKDDKSIATTPLLSRAASAFRSLTGGGSTISNVSSSSSNVESTPLSSTPAPDRNRLFGDDIELQTMSRDASDIREALATARYGKLQSQEDADNQAHEERRLHDIQLAIEKDEAAAVLLAVQVTEVDAEFYSILARDRERRDTYARSIAQQPSSFSGESEQIATLTAKVASLEVLLEELRSKLRARSVSPASRRLEPPQESSTPRAVSFTHQQIDRWKKTDSRDDPEKPDLGYDSDDSFEKTVRGNVKKNGKSSVNQSNPMERKGAAGSGPPDEPSDGDDSDGDDDDDDDEGDARVGGGDRRVTRRKKKPFNPPDPKPFPNPLKRLKDKGIEADLMHWVSFTDAQANKHKLAVQRKLSTYERRGTIWTSNDVRQNIPSGELSQVDSDVQMSLTYQPVQPDFDFKSHVGGLTIELWERMSTSIYAWATTSIRNIFPNVFAMMTLTCKTEMVSLLERISTSISNGTRPHLRDDIVLTSAIDTAATLNGLNYPVFMCRLYACVMYKIGKKNFEHLVVSMFKQHFSQLKPLPKKFLDLWTSFAGLHQSQMNVFKNLLYRMKMVTFVNQHHVTVSFEQNSGKISMGVRKLLENAYKLCNADQIFINLMEKVEFNGNKREGQNARKPKTVKALFEKFAVASMAVSRVTTLHEEEIELFKEQSIANYNSSLISPSQERNVILAPRRSDVNAPRKIERREVSSARAPSATSRGPRIPSKDRRFFVMNKVKPGAIPSKFHFMTVSEFDNFEDTKDYEYEMIDLEPDHESTNVLLHLMKQGTIDDYQPPPGEQPKQLAICLLKLWHGNCQREKCPFNHDNNKMNVEKARLIKDWGKELFNLKSRPNNTAIQLHFMSLDFCSESGASDNDEMARAEEKESSARDEFFSEAFGED